MGDLSFGTIMLGIVFGSLGAGYFIYGKKQDDWITLITGIVLCIFPYFFANIWLLLVVGSALAAVPFIARKWL